MILGIGCGGGGGSTTTTAPPPTPTPVTGDFSLQIPFTQIKVQQRGVSQFLEVFITRLQGFSGDITISLQGLPAGVTATANGPTTLSAGSTNGGVVFSLSASASAVIATTAITVVGTSGTVNHSGNASVIVQQAAPFHLNVSANSATLTPGSTMPIQVSLVADPGNSPSILLTTLPPPSNGGVTVSIPPFGITTAQPNLTVTLNAELIAQPLQNFPLTFIATDTPTGQTSITDFTLNVGVPFTRTPGLTRSTFIRTDENPTDGVYDPIRKLFFTTITNLNEVRVFSTVDRSIRAVIPAPFPQGIDFSADGSKVYVGSNFVSQITVIDANTLQVVQRVPGPVRSSPAAGDSGLDFPRRLVTLASGKVLLLASHAATTEDHIYIWDPTTGTIVQNDPPGLFFFNDIIRSGDRTKALTYSTGNSGTAISTYDVATDTFSPLLNISSVNNLAYNPDGSQLAGWSGSALPNFLVFLDGQFNQLASIPALSGVFSADLIYGLDGTSVYVTCNYPLDGQIVAVYDAQTLTPRGIVPDYKAGNAFDFKAFAIDETGMIYRGDQMGLDLVDVSVPGALAFPRFGLGSQSTNPQLVNLSAPTTVTLGGVFTAGTNRVFFGDSAASPSSVEGTIGTNNGHFTQVTVPAGKAPGATNMIVTRSDGWYATEPDGVSFGPQVLFSSVGGPPSGGGKTTIFGYGFVSSSTQVTVGGVAASNVQVTGSTGAFPIPVNTITFDAPAGILGSADISINTARGSVTVPKTYTYLSSAQVFPRVGLLNQIIYDQPRQKLYITNSDHNQVEVFSLASQSFLSPIAVGTNPIEIAQSPDGTLLAVTNEADGTVSVIDPDQAKVIHTWTVVVASDLDPGFCRGRVVTLTPVKIHRMLVDVNCTALLANGHLRVVDLDTGNINCSGVTQCNANGIDINFADGLAATTSSKDGSKVLLAELGTIGGSLLGFWDVDGNTMLTKGRLGGSSQISINADGNTFVFDGGVFDSQLRLLSIPQDVTYLNTLRNSFNNDFGTEVNPSGSLLFFPQVSGGLPPVAGGVDIFDLRRQHLAARLNLPEPLAFAADPMALDETGTKMFLISASGITIAQLAQSPLSIGTLNPVAGTAATLVTIRGSGFQSGAKVTFGSSQVSSTFIDINTIQASVPVLPAGPIRVTITNPDGTQYSLDAAFTVN